MGQQNISHQSNILNSWQQHPTQPNILYNVITNEQIHRHFVTITDPNQLRCYSIRMHQAYTYLCRVVYYHPSPETIYETSPKSFYIYTDRFLPLTQLTPQIAITILKAFKKLMSNYQPFRVERGMIGQNQRGQVKIWVNTNPVVNFPQNPAKNQQQMLADITSIFMLYNRSITSQLVPSRNFNEAINKLIKPQNQPIHNYSHRPQEQQPIINTTNITNHIYRNQDRTFNSQGKQRNSSSDYQLPYRNANSSAKNTNPSGNQCGKNDVNKNDYHHTPLIPSNINHMKGGSPKIKFQKDNIFKYIQGNNKNNSTINLKKYPYHKKQSTSNKISKANNSQTIQNQQTNQYQNPPKYQLNIKNQHLPPRDDINKYKHKQTNDRIQTFSNINQFIIHDQQQTHKTNQIKNNIPSFIPRKKLNNLTDNNSHDARSSAQLFYDNNLIKGLEKNPSGTKFTFKPQIKKDKIKQFQNNDKKKRISNQQFPIEKKQIQNFNKYKKQACSSGQFNLDGYHPYINNQKNIKKKNQVGIPSVMSQSGGQQGKKNKVQHKVQSMDNSSLIDQQNKIIKDVDLQLKRKSKEEVTKQLKKQFGQILFNDIQQKSKPPKAKNTQKYLQMKYQNMNKVKNNNFNSNQQINEKEKLQINTAKYAQNVKDQLIKQKVQKKKATFAQLKVQAMKILSDDLN